MILLITTSFSVSVQTIVQFLVSENLPFKRLNIDDLISKNNYEIEIINSTVLIDGISLDEFDKVICWKNNIESISSIYKRVFPEITDDELAYKTVELKSILNFILQLIKDKIVLGYISDDIHKLQQNAIANKVGLKVPETIVSNKEQSFNRIQKSEYIIKPILKTYVSKYNKSFVEKMEEVDLESLQLKTAFPFIAQKTISYEYEIRVFYINNKFYPAKLLKSSDLLDYRLNQAYRFERYKITEDLKTKLLDFVKYFDLKSACFDLLVQERNIWFLESNPTGNFVGLMNQCNYDLHSEFLELFSRAPDLELVNNNSC